MRKWFAHHLRRLADWLDPPAAPVPLVDPVLVSRAALVVVEAEATRHTSSFKRTIAMKAMRAAFPGVPRRDVSLAIELALRQVIP